MRHRKLLKLVEKYAQLVTKTGVSLWDLFKKLPPPDLTKIPNAQQGDGMFEIWVAILPGPRISFNINGQRLALLKKYDPSNEEVTRLDQVLSTLYKTLNSSYTPKMLALIKQNVTPEDYKNLQQNGLSGEYTIWTLNL